MSSKNSDSQISNIISIITVILGIILWFFFRMGGIFITSIGIVFGIISLIQKQKYSGWVLLFGIISWIAEVSIWVYDILVESGWNNFIN